MEFFEGDERTSTGKARENDKGSILRFVLALCG